MAIKTIGYHQLTCGYATSFFGDDGAWTTRVALQGSQNNKLKIIARTSFLAITRFFDVLFSKISLRERKWVPVSCDSSTILLNINSLCKRTLLTRQEILAHTPKSLSARLAEPEKISWEYGRLNNALFPHVLFINMDKRTDRKDSFNEHLKSIGSDLKYEQFKAFVGRDLPATEILKMSRGSSAVRENRDDRAGRLGCFKSHLAAVEYAKAQGYSEVLILEDDVRFIPGYFTSSYARQARQELPNDWGVLFLGHYDATQKKVDATQWKTTNYSDHLIQPGCPYDCHAYLVNATMYDTLIGLLKAEFQKGKMRALDVVIGQDLVRTGKVFACKDNIAIQNEGFSDIREKNFKSNYTKELFRFQHLFTARKEAINKTPDGLPIMDPILAGTLYQMMHHVGRIFDKYGIQYVVESGTALGIERHKGLIPHDDDIDLRLLEGEEAKLNNEGLKRDLQAVGLEIVDHWVGAKICPIKDHPLGHLHNRDGYRFKTPSLDLFFSEKIIMDGESVQIYKSAKAKHHWPEFYIKESELYPICKGTFGPVQVNVMHKQREYCERAYGKDCFGEIYLQRDHLREKRLPRRPVALTQLTPPPYKEWEGIAPLPLADGNYLAPQACGA